MRGTILRRISGSLPFVVRVVLGAIFLLSGISKIRQPYDFLATVFDYAAVGPNAGIFLAMVLPWIELLVGLSLVGGVLVTASFLLATFLLGSFTCLQFRVLAMGIKLNCGCWGSAMTEEVSRFTLARTGILFLMAAAVALLHLMRMAELSASGEPEPPGR